MNTPHIQILMSTYNGEKYVSEQLDSILEQEGVYTTIFIRDDGSKDSTVQIITDYIHKYPERIMLEEGKNLGYGQSFLTLFKKSDEHADYIAFSDQDDVWLPHKLQRAVEKMKETSSQMYASNLTVTDEHLKELYTLKRGDVGIIQSFFTVVYGCTQVLDIHAVIKIKKILTENPSSHLVSHDWIVYTLVKVLGDKVYFDTQSFILYRQHNNNVGGAPSRTIMHTIKHKCNIRRYVNILYRARTHIEFIQKARKNTILDPKAIEFLDKMDYCKTHLLERIIYTLSMRFHANMLYNLGIKIAFVCNFFV